MLTAIKHIVLVFSITFSIAQADEPGFVLQNGSVVTDSSKECIRTAATDPENIPPECSGVPQTVSSDDTSDSVEKFDGCANLQCTPEVSTLSQGNNESILAEVPFMFDRSDLTTQATRKLDSFISAIRQKVSNIISVFGHTDSFGTNEYNDGLSERRAYRVRDYLVNSGIPSKDISVTGMGESSPVANNDTRNGRAKNRRVVIEAK